LARAIDTIAKALADVKEGDEPRMTLELAILRAARPQLDPTRQALLQRVEALERTIAGGHGVAAGEPSRATAPHAAPADDQASRPRPDDPPTQQPSPSSELEGEPPASSSDGPAEPEPEPARGPSAVAVEEVKGERLDLERINALWPAVLDQMRDTGLELLSAVFSAARPVAVDLEQRLLEVGFPPSAAFNKRKAEAQDARERFTDAVATILGERLRPVYVLLEGDPNGEPDAEPELSEDELIEHLKAEFDAEEFKEAEKLDAEEAR
jgi:DNA polymerase-3 subunit gamma/tau